MTKTPKVGRRKRPMEARIAPGSDALQVGDTVDVEWTTGEFWCGGVLTAIGMAHATVRLTTGWNVYPPVGNLRRANAEVSRRG